MAVISELIRTEENGKLSFGDYTLAAKAKLDNFEKDGDIYKVKTFKEITKLERNGLFVYESVPGTAVVDFEETADTVTFTVEGPEDAQITLGLEEETEYEIDIAGAVGIGVLSVIKDIGLKEPYVGDTILITSEIADDLTYYYATSEQVPSSVGLGVLMTKENTVEQAGGFIIQLMPDATEEVIDKLEKRIKEVKSVTEMLENGMTPEKILEHILGDMELEILDTVQIQFHCNCSKERVSKAVMSIGAKDLKEMVDDNKPIEVNCHFCNSHYTFSPEELEQMLEAVTK